MGMRPRRRRNPVHLRHKVLGSLLTLMGLACMAVCGLLVGYLADKLLAGSTMEIIVFGAFAFVLGIIFLFMAWHQFVVAPKQDYMRECFNRSCHSQRFDKPGGQTT
ncbi:MAG: hypothetical protein HY910_10855 [Desulfarculus sp.]|nr:hypothetical protein [Desulfarculus sp.]